MDERRLGTLLLAAAAVIAVVGLALRFGLLSWFGRLPGDVRVEGEHGRLYVPITSMLLLSLLLSLLAWLWRRVT